MWIGFSIFVAVCFVLIYIKATKRPYVYSVNASKNYRYNCELHPFNYTVANIPTGGTGIYDLKLDIYRNDIKINIYGNSPSYRGDAIIYRHKNNSIDVIISNSWIVRYNPGKINFGTDQQINRLICYHPISFWWQMRKAKFRMRKSIKRARELHDANCAIKEVIE